MPIQETRVSMRVLLLLTGTLAGVGNLSPVNAQISEEAVLTTPQRRIGEPETQSAAQAEQIARLHRELAAKAGQEPRAWLTNPSTEAWRSLIQEVQADADARVSLLSGGGEAGWDKGFFLASADGAFRLRIMGQIQFRWVGSFQDDAVDDDSRTGFENTRTRLGFQGHLFDPSNQFLIWAVIGSPSSVLDIWYKKDLGDGWVLQVGQFKLPNWREWVISEVSQQFTERSVLSARYRALNSQGVQVYFTGERFRFQAAFSDGLQSYNTGFNVPTANSPYLQAQTEFAVTGRAAFRLGEEATWKQFADFESWDDGPTGALLGASLHYQRGEYGDDTFENEILQWSVDGAFELNGMNFYTALISTSIENEAGVNRNELGFLAQAGYFLTSDLEIVARYEWGDLDGAGGGAGDDLSILTVGINKFYYGHALKWSTDVGYAFEAVDSVWGGASRGWRGDAGGAGADGQVVVRSQINILF